MANKDKLAEQKRQHYEANKYQKNVYAYQLTRESTKAKKLAQNEEKILKNEQKWNDFKIRQKIDIAIKTKKITGTIINKTNYFLLIKNNKGIKECFQKQDVLKFYKI